MSSDPEIRRDVPSGPVPPLPAFLARSAHLGSPPAPHLIAEGWMIGPAAPRAASPGPLAAPPSAPSGRSPFPLEAIEID